MSKHDNPFTGTSARFEHPTCGRVDIEYNHEDEIKIALIPGPGAQVPADIVAMALWRAYVAQKTEEFREAFPDQVIHRADGRTLDAPLHYEDKAKRTRRFETKPGGHPERAELRIEGLRLMIKIADEFNARSSIIRRTEIKVKQQFPGRFGFRHIPGPHGAYLAEHFPRKSERFSGSMTESFRRKLTVPMHAAWKSKDLIIAYERACDLGVGVSLAGHRRDITEFEGEVKSIHLYDDYMRGRPVDLREAPDYCGWTPADIEAITTRFLNTRLRHFLDFARNRLDLGGYADVGVEPVRHSKSKPEMDALHQVLAQGGFEVKQAVLDAIARDNRGDPFEVDPRLNRIRLALAA